MTGTGGPQCMFLLEKHCTQPGGLGMWFVAKPEMVVSSSPVRARLRAVQTVVLRILRVIQRLVHKVCPMVSGVTQ